MKNIMIIATLCLGMNTVGLSMEEDFYDTDQQLLDIAIQESLKINNAPKIEEKLNDTEQQLLDFVIQESLDTNAPKIEEQDGYEDEEFEWAILASLNSSQGQKIKITEPNVFDIHTIIKEESEKIFNKDNEYLRIKRIYDELSYRIHLYEEENQNQRAKEAEKERENINKMLATCMDKFNLKYAKLIQNRYPQLSLKRCTELAKEAGFDDADDSDDDSEN